MADEDHSEDRVTVWMSSNLIDEMDEWVDWRHSSRSEWVRDAARFRIMLDEALDEAGLELPDDQEEREEMVQEIVDIGIRVGEYLDEQEESE